VTYLALLHDRRLFMLRTLGCLLMACAVLSLASCGGKGERSNVEKIVGRWERAGIGNDPLTEANVDFMYPTVEFTSDGKMKLQTPSTSNGEYVTIHGSYQVEGDRIHTKARIDGKEMSETKTITKLTDNELATKEDETGRIEEFKRKK
jgi:uncharacterized protein (TIGR03066 family)